MNGVIYARYSSDNQREESIEGQLRECQAFAEKNDITILNTYIDRAFSAKTDNRPEFQHMISDSKKKMFDVVLVWKYDRFARNRLDSLMYKQLLQRNNIKLISVTEPIMNSSVGIIVESMIDSYNEYYSAELAEKVTRGMTENALKGKYNGGTLPIGYYIDEDKYFQIDPLTAPIVLEAFQKYDEGMTMKEIVDFLKLKGLRTKRNGVISINSLNRMLHNRRYIGEYKFQDIVTPDVIPAIVPKDLFDRVQEKLAKNKKAPARKKAEDEYLLTTKLYCGKCGCYMVGESGTSQQKKIVHRYYKCVSVKNHKGCDKKTVKKYWVEDLTIKVIKQIIFDDRLLDNLADEIIKYLGQESTLLPQLRKQLKDCEKGIDNLLNAIQAGIFTPSTKERLESLEQQKEELSIRIAQEEIIKPPIDKDKILFWLHRFRKMDTTKLEQRKRLIDSFVNAIYLYDDKIVFTFNYKDGSKTISMEEIENSALSSDLTSLGARSHDIDDGILSWEDFDTQAEFKETVRKWRKQRKVFRIKHVSWWDEELPSDAEIQNAEKNLAKIDYKVDYVISHCAPQSIVSWLMGGYAQPDKLTMYFEDLALRLNFKNWFFGHYHDDRKIMSKYILLYDQIVRIL